MRFVHEGTSQRAVFATGAAADAVHAEVERLGGRRAMVIASRREAGVAEQVTAGIPTVLRHDEVVRHVPVAVAERARAAAADARADVLVAIGGGSTTGLAKAVALTSGLPVVAVPTTYAGSEATNVWGMTEHGRKSTGVDARVLPRAVVYDAELLVSLPVDISVASGLNAVAHGVDAMWGPRVDPIDQALAVEGIRALREGLPAVVAEPVGIAGREQTLYGAYVTALAFTCAGSGLHHKVCHVLGGMFDLPHAETHAVVLPHVLALNAPGVPEAATRLAAAFGAETAIDGLALLRGELNAPSSLRSLGMPEDGIAAAIEPILASVPDGNPVPVTREVVSALLRAAWSGAGPVASRV
jgi:alcohol dehydrogenase class IV